MKLQGFCCTLPVVGIALELCDGDLHKRLRQMAIEQDQGMHSVSAQDGSAMGTQLPLEPAGSPASMHIKLQWGLQVAKALEAIHSSQSSQHR